MSSVKRSSVIRHVAKPLVVAIAFALPGAAAFAATMNDVVTTRSDQSVAAKYGRDSVYGFSPEARPYNAAQQGPRDMGFIGDVFHKTGAFFSSAWDKTVDLFSSAGSSGTSALQYEPQPYGRAGGYIGSGRVEILSEQAHAYAANSSAVRSGEHINAQANSTAVVPEEQGSLRANSAADKAGMEANRDTISGSANEGAASAGTANTTYPEDRHLTPSTRGTQGTNEPVADGMRGAQSTVYPEDRKLTPNTSGTQSTKEPGGAQSTVYPEDRKLTPSASSPQSDNASGGAAIGTGTGQSAVYPEDRKLTPNTSGADRADQPSASAAETHAPDQSTVYPEDQKLTPAASDTQSAEEDIGRTSGRRFDHPQRAHGQMENETTTR
jgi:hypothetical protein